MPPILPWSSAEVPLMLAPMQGLTNRSLRALFIDRVSPDVVFTEFLRVKANAPLGLSSSDLLEVSGPESVPLVVQLVGHGRQALVAAAESAQKAGAAHLNLNMGCPYGRTTSTLTGGGMLKKPEALPEILHALRDAIDGSFSVKVRAGYEDPEQVLSLLPLFEEVGIDFLILHPRTVLQKYSGTADHGLTAEVVKSTSLPVIANGDVTDAAGGRKVLESGAAGLMLGRGAIGDPLLFARIRGEAPGEPSAEERTAEFRSYLFDLAERYEELFCGDTQVHYKLKEVLHFVSDPHLQKGVKKLKRSQNLDSFTGILEGLR